MRRWMVLSLVACGSTGEPAFQAELRAYGGPAEVTAGGWTVTLTRAEVAIGPIYLCATAAASADLCPRAVAEFTDVAVVDAIDASAQVLGEIDALPAEARSAMLDYGITWLPTQDRPVVQPAAPGGHTARFAGRAVRGDMSVEFTAEVDLAPALRGTRAVEGLRLAPAELDPGGALALTVPAASWWAGVEFDALAAAGSGPHALGPDSEIALAVRFAMTAFPPQLTWSQEE